jgi:hypothetical protein
LELPHPKQSLALGSQQWPEEEAAILQQAYAQCSRVTCKTTAAERRTTLHLRGERMTRTWTVEILELRVHDVRQTHDATNLKEQIVAVYVGNVAAFPGP